MMRSAYRGHMWSEAEKNAAIVAADPRSGVETVTEAEYIVAKSCLATSRREDAFAMLERLSQDVSSNYGAEAAYMIIQDCGDFIKTLIAKFDPDYSRCCVSDILYFTIVTHYINEQKKRYISSGERTINHVTGTQEYKIRRFGYRKAYCNLHIEYNPKIKWLMRILFVFRKLLAKLDKIRIIHLINSLLKMQEYASERK